MCSSDLFGNSGRANLVVSDFEKKLSDKLSGGFGLPDYGLQLSEGTDGPEIRSSSLFLSDMVEVAIDRSELPVRKGFGYFVNTLQSGDRSVPYSFVAGVEGPPMPPDGRSEDMVVNSWLADQLGLEIGSEVSVSAYIPGSYGTLSEATHTFVVREIVPIAGPAADHFFTPSIPGMENAKTCGDWDPALPIDLKRIRPVDEEYWRRYGGLPKAFIRLDKARNIWRNRFGSLTAARFSGNDVRRITAGLLGHLSAQGMGMVEQDIYTRKRHGSAHSVDFSILFASLGLFIILAALLLASLQFGLHLERRHRELAIMQVAGFSRRLLARLLSIECTFIAFVGSVVGILPGIAYAAVTLYLLESVWRGALNFTQIRLHVEPLDLVLGSGMAMAASLFALGMTMRSFFSCSKAFILSGQSEIETAPNAGPIAPIVFFGLAMSTVFLSIGTGSLLTMALFFLAGLFMLGCTTRLSAWLLVRASRHGRPFSLDRLALKYLVRKFRRSKTVIRVMAGAVFLVLAVSANHRAPLDGRPGRETGTGGFSLYVETAMPVIGEIDTEAGRYALKLEALDEKTRVTRLAMLEGSDSSCLNLNRVSRPTLLGVKPGDLAGRFTLQSALFGLEPEWKLLERDFGDPLVIPAIADADVIQWSLGKSLGDNLEIEGSNGQVYKIRLVGALENSIFQGRVVIALSQFYRLWPESTGSRVLLVDSSPENEEKEQAVIADALQRYGAHVQRAATRLAEYNRVQNTYLSIFLALGAIGLLLGCGGLATLLRRNLLERKDELEFLRVLGFKHSAIESLIFKEHALLFIVGVASGLVSASVSVLPALRQAGSELPLPSMVTVALLLIVTGLTILYAGIDVPGFCKMNSSTILTGEKR